MKTLFVAHDIGGAQLLYSYILCNALSDYLIVAEGPALQPFEGIDRKSFIGRAQGMEMIKAAEIRQVITGTSWDSDVELELILQAKAAKIPTVSVLDHWTNYRERFRYPESGWEKFLPDTLWAHDPTSLHLLQSLFPSVRSELKENFFLTLNQRLFSGRLALPAENSILYMTEPTSKHFGAQLGYNEFGALELFLNKYEKIFPHGPTGKITLRPHPSERDIAPKKYGVFMQRGHLQLSLEPNVFLDILSHRCVVGCDTMGMYYSAQLGRTVYCSIPQNGQECSLPISGLIYLKDL